MRKFWKRVEPGLAAAVLIGILVLSGLKIAGGPKEAEAGQPVSTTSYRHTGYYMCTLYDSVTAAEDSVIFRFPRKSYNISTSVSTADSAQQVAYFDFLVSLPCTLFVWSDAAVGDTLHGNPAVRVPLGAFNFPGHTYTWPGSDYGMVDSVMVRNVSVTNVLCMLTGFN